MHKSLFKILWIIRVLLCGKPDQAFFQHKDLKRLEASDYNINSEIVLEPIYKMWVSDVLTDYISRLLVNLCILTDDLNSLATR